MTIKTLTDASIILDEIAFSCSSFNLTPPGSLRRVSPLLIQFMCKSGKSLLRWLTFKHAHQSPGHLTHLWDQVWLRISVYRVLSPDDDVNVWIIWPHFTKHPVCLDWVMCCRSSHVSSYVQAVTACQYPLVLWNYCKRKETPWWLRALSSTHDWPGLPSLMIVTGHNLPPTEKLAENVFQ